MNAHRSEAAEVALALEMTELSGDDSPAIRDALMKRAWAALQLNFPADLPGQVQLILTLRPAELLMRTQQLGLRGQGAPLGNVEGLLNELSVQDPLRGQIVSLRGCSDAQIAGAVSLSARSSRASLLNTLAMLAPNTWSELPWQGVWNEHDPLTGLELQGVFAAASAAGERFRAVPGAGVYRSRDIRAPLALTMLLQLSRLQQLSAPQLVDWQAGWVALLAGETLTPERQPQLLAHARFDPGPLFTAISGAWGRAAAEVILAACPGAPAERRKIASRRAAVIATERQTPAFRQVRTDLRWQALWAADPALSQERALEIAREAGSLEGLRLRQVDDVTYAELTLLGGNLTDLPDDAPRLAGLPRQPDGWRQAQMLSAVRSGTPLAVKVLSLLLPLPRSPLEEEVMTALETHHATLPLVRAETDGALQARLLARLTKQGAPCEEPREAACSEAESGKA